MSARVAREEAGAAGAAMIAAVSLGIYPDMTACVADWVDPLLGEAERPDPALVQDLRTDVPDLSRRARGAPADLARHGRCAAGARGMSRKLAIIGDRFMLAAMFEAAIRERCGDGDSPSARSTCPGPTSRWSTATPRPAWTG